MIPKYIKEGKNRLCYAYVLGKCHGQVCGKCPEQHVPALDVLDEFATALQQTLMAGVKCELPTTPQHHNNLHTTQLVVPQNATNKLCEECLLCGIASVTYGGEAVIGR